MVPTSHVIFHISFAAFSLICYTNQMNDKRFHYEKQSLVENTSEKLEAGNNLSIIIITAASTKQLTD